MSSFPSAGDHLSAEVHLLEDNARSKPLTATQARVLLRQAAEDYSRWLRLHGTLSMKHWEGCGFVKETVERARKKGRPMRVEEFRRINAAVDDMLDHVYRRF